MTAPSTPLCADGEDCVIVFARTPTPGRVKSRLWTHLTPEQSSRLHCAAANDVLLLLERSFPKARKWLFLSREPADGIPSSGLDVPPGFGITLQEGEDLGERMGKAFERAFASGARRVIIFGSDSPTLPPEVVQSALDFLRDRDLVLGPAEDGGYYLIGCRRFDAGLFWRVDWSTPRTLDQTLANAARLGYHVALTEKWFDLDEWKDVERVLDDARRGVPLPENLGSFLKELERTR